VITDAVALSIIGKHFDHATILRVAHTFAITEERLT
jgi:hypothetical protein